MSIEVFSSTVHIPNARQCSVDEERQEPMSPLEVERMTYNLKKKLEEANEIYDEDAVLATLQKELSAIEERFDIKFNLFRVTLANNRMREVKNEKSHVFADDGPAKY